jgi:hypothetical protein
VASVPLPKRLIGAPPCAITTRAVPIRDESKRLLQDLAAWCRKPPKIYEAPPPLYAPLATVLADPARRARRIRG